MNQNGNRKVIVPLVGPFLLLVLDWKTLVLMSCDLPLQMRWCENASKEKNQLQVAVRGSRTSALKLPINNKTSNTLITITFYDIKKKFLNKCNKRGKQ